MPFGGRIVGAKWGPRGFESSFRRLASLGFIPATIVDIGASDGRWTTQCMEVFPDAQYSLFDPLTQNEPSLRELSRRHTGLTFWCGAIGARRGRLTIHEHGDQTSFFKSTDFPGTPLDVEVRTLDSFIEEMAFKPPMLIKADVQGYEREILRGAQQCLDMTEVLLLEVSFRQVYESSPLAHDVIAELADNGYRIYDICSYTQRDRDQELAHSDILFVRRGSRIFAYEGWH